MKKRLVTGKLLKTRGLSGEIGLDPYLSDLKLFQNLKRFYVEDAQGQVFATLELDQMKLAGQKVFLHFVHYDSREAVQNLTNSYLSVDREELPQPTEDSYYIADLIGCRVIDRTYGDLGVVAEAYDTGPQTLFKVEAPGVPALFLPWVKPLLRNVDPERQIIEVTLPDGLYEVYRT